MQRKTFEIVYAKSCMCSAFLAGNGSQCMANAFLNTFKMGTTRDWTTENARPKTADRKRRTKNYFNRVAEHSQ